MSRDDRRDRTLAPGLAARLDPVCDRFESEWLAGRRPRVEEFLPQVEESDRPALLRELLALDLEYRARHGERPAGDDYRRRLPEHTGVVDVAFAAVSSVGPAASVERTPLAADMLPGGSQAAACDPASLRRAGRYEIEEEIGRGGMGVVLRARDPDLNRPLALKVLLDDCRGRPDLEQRFREEAQVTGQLQHPGIPPVHEVGVLPDGRPFFAMKLIRGRTLADLLKERTSTQIDRPRFVAIFEQICQTLAYAHSKGVIHRDLKPANVMVGAFGEVQVMDWGLAKVLTGPRPAPDDDSPTGSGIATVRTGESGLSSQAGSVMGTPAYMAPEQARGEVDQLDERCDVFGLGAILCVILVGRPPYLGSSGVEVHARAARGEVGEVLALLDQCGGDDELVRLARRCLAADREERPRDAGELARAVGAYLAGVQERLREAERQRAAAEARAAEAAARAKAERHARRLLLGLTASVLGTLTVVGGVFLWVQRDRSVRAAKEVETVREITAALEQAELWRQQGRYPEAREATRKAEGLLSGGGESLRPRVEEVLADLDMLARLGDVRLELARVATGPEGRAARRAPPAEQGAAEYGVPVLAAEVDDAAQQYERAFTEYGIPVLTLEPDDAAGRVSRRAIRAELVTALDYWSALAHDDEARRKLREVARQAEPDPAGVAAGLREALTRQDAEAVGQLLSADERIQALPPGTLVHVAGSLLVRGDAERAVRLLRPARDRYPGDFWVNYELAAALSALRPPRLEEAVRCLTVATALRGDNAVCYYNLGVALYQLGRPPEAATAFRKAGELKPDYGAAHHSLGVALLRLGDLPGADRAFRDAIRAQPDVVHARYGLANLLARTGPAGEAEAALREVTRVAPNHANAHNDLGNVLADQRRLDEAIEEYRLALTHAPDDAKIHKNLGHALGKRGRLGEAEKEFREAVRLAPDDPEMHNDLGFALYSMRQPDQAIACYKKALALVPDYALALCNLGDALMDQNHLDEAVEALRKAVKSQPNFVNAHNELGVALLRQGKVPEAIASYREAVRVKPDFAAGHYNLGDALMRTGDLAGAIASCERAVAINPRYAEAHINIGLAHLQQGHFAGGVARLQQGYDLLDRADPRRPQVRAWLDEGRNLARIEEKLPAVLKGEARPADNAERVRLAEMCLRYRRLPLAAARLYHEALTAEPRLADDVPAGVRLGAARAAALSAGGRGPDADRLDDRERAAWRKRARDWLRADLDWWGQALARDRVRFAGPLRQVLRQWQADADLAAVRDREALDQLSEDERRDWRRLWDDAAALLRKAEEKP